MIKNNSLFKVFNNTIVKHALFWVFALVYYLSVSWPYKKNKIMLLEATLFELILQILIAYLVIYLSLNS